jgi:hypothetical protein
MPNERMGNRSLPEPAEVATGTVVIAVAGFLGFVALSMTGLFFYLRSEVPGAFRAAIEHQFPEPRLQKTPQGDLRRFEQKQRDLLSDYGWVDRSAGVVRIPIEEAMRIIAAKGDHAFDASDRSAGASIPANPDGAVP